MIQSPNLSLRSYSPSTHSLCLSCKHRTTRESSIELYEYCLKYGNIKSIVFKTDRCKDYENIKSSVTGICGKCGTKQELSIRKTGKGEDDWCYWCPNCEDQIANSAVKVSEP